MRSVPTSLKKYHAHCVAGAVWVLFLFGLAWAQSPSTSTSMFTAGDALEIRLFPDTSSSLNDVYPIDGAGFADFPILGLIQVTNRSEAQLIELLRPAYLDYLHYPNIQIRPLIRVGLLGGFQNPGLYWIDPRLSLWSAIQVAGGPQREDGVRKLRWERDRMTVKYDLVQDYQSGQSLRQIGFRSGDQIRVTASPLRTKWEVFRQDVLPILSFALTSAISALTLYEVWRD